MRLLVLLTVFGFVAAELPVLQISPEFRLLVVNDTYKVLCVAQASGEESLFTLTLGTTTLQFNALGKQHAQGDGVTVHNSRHVTETVNNINKVNMSLEFIPSKTGKLTVQCSTVKKELFVIEAQRQQTGTSLLSCDFVVPKLQLQNLTTSDLRPKITVVGPPSASASSDSFDVSYNCTTEDGEDSQRFCASLKLKQGTQIIFGRYRFELRVGDKEVVTSAPYDLNSTRLEVKNCASQTGSNCIADSEHCVFKCNVLGWPFVDCSVQPIGDLAVDSSKRMDVECLTAEQLIKVTLRKPEQGDSGFYNVTAQSGTAEVASGEGQLQIRVKDKLAPLWPFLGICAEVVILCGIILFFEKRHQKKLLQQEQDEAGASEPMVKSSGKGGNEVRQRATKA